MNLSNQMVKHGIDHERLNQLHSGDRRQIVSVLNLFLDEVMPDFYDLERGVRQQQWPEVADMAHKIVPWMGMAGLTSLETELRGLEQLAKRNPVAVEVTAHWNQFKAGLDEAVPLLVQELAHLA